MIFNGERELAYTVEITDVKKHPNADRLDIVVVNGWNVISGRDEFKKGEIAVFFEIDSKLPEVKPFTDMEFLASKHYKISSQRIRGVISQGLVVPVRDLVEYFNVKENIESGVPLTKTIGVTYAVAEDNARKGNGKNKNAKYTSMSARHKKLFSKKPFRWLMRREWGRKLLFVFFGKKKDTPLGFPTKFEFVHKTDEERCENMPWILQNKDPWIKTTKIDGTSATYILERKKFGKFEFYVTSRNVRQRTPDQKNYHSSDTETNVYWDMAYKYYIKDFLKDLLVKHKNWKYVCLQGEIAGKNIQGNPHKFDDVRFFGFNLIDSENGRWNSVKAATMCDKYEIPWVPIVDDNYILPDDFEEFKLSADGQCEAPGSSGLREGYVYRSQDGELSFKNVSREYCISRGL